MTTHASLLASGTEFCERHGYDVDRPNRGWLPGAIATAAESTESATSTGELGADALFGSVTTPVAIEPLGADDVDPTTVLSRLWNNSNHGRRSLFVVPGSDADVLAQTVYDHLAAPPCVAAEDDVGCRTFYNGPDRIALAGGGYALHKTTDSAFQWFEEVEVNGAGTVGTEPADGGPRTGSDGKRVVLADDDDVVAVFDDVDGLGCPPASAFPYSYRRDPRDKCFHVTDASGREVGVFTDVRGMRAAAYEPVPMPFVPEHLFDASVRNLWGVLAVDESGTRLYTVDGCADGT